jgi:hypothetical protein
MIFPGSVVSFVHDPETQRLTATFDSSRTLVFYHVPRAVRELLGAAASLDEAFAEHVFGEYAWTEIGACEWPAPSPRNDSRSTRRRTGD